MKKLSIVAIVLSVSAIVFQFFILATQKKDVSDQEYKQALTDHYKVYSPVLPESLDFAGEATPLDVFSVRENLDRALLMTTYWQSNTVLILKRAYRFFPVIEKILQQNGIPLDFKYLCVAESGLVNVTSSAKAQGYWQFMKATGEKYNLEVSEDVDERNSIEKSTQAACDFLNSLYKTFGSWTLAAAAYNCGENGLGKQLQLQNVSNYYDLYLNQETAFYLFRILAYKLIMQNPQQYGFYLRTKDLYPGIPCKEITVNTPVESLHAFASEQKTTYKMLKTLNPWMVNTKITNKTRKTYTIKLPVANGELQRTIQKEEDRKPDLLKGL